MKEFEILILGSRVRIKIQVRAPSWVNKEYRNADGAFGITRKDGLRIWVRASQDRHLVEDVFLHECGHAIWWILKEYWNEDKDSEAVADALVGIHWELEKGLREIRKIGKV